MENIRIRYSNKMVVNIGQYQNLQPEYEIQADVAPGEVLDAFAKIKDRVDSLLEEDVNEILREKNA